MWSRAHPKHGFNRPRATAQVVWPHGYPEGRTGQRSVVSAAIVLR
jgi:hypothetical protein